jgi:SMC interacting uncharacterized protein involved in chromosome segregation
VLKDFSAVKTIIDRAKKSMENTYAEMNRVLTHFQKTSQLITAHQSDMPLDEDEVQVISMVNTKKKKNGFYGFLCNLDSYGSFVSDIDNTISALTVDSDLLAEYIATQSVSSENMEKVQSEIERAFPLLESIVEATKDYLQENFHGESNWDISSRLESERDDAGRAGMDLSDLQYILVPLQEI